MKRNSLVVVAAVKADRAKGMSIPALVSKYSIPKTTVWHQVKDVHLSEDIKKKIRSKQGGSALRNKKSWLNAEKEAEILLSDFSEKSVWPVLLTALYWSEGTKKGGFIFTNTDRQMIRVYLKILRLRLKIKDEDIIVLIRTCAPMSPIACRKYWSAATGIAVGRIRINHDDRQNKSKTTYGMCRVTVKKGGYFLKLVHCLTKGLADTMLQV